VSSRMWSKRFMVGLMIARGGCVGACGTAEILHMELLLAPRQSKLVTICSRPP
jgi:hypothetical protein